MLQVRFALMMGVALAVLAGLLVRERECKVDRRGRDDAEQGVVPAGTVPA